MRDVVLILLDSIVHYQYWINHHDDAGSDVYERRRKYHSACAWRWCVLDDGAFDRDDDDDDGGVIHETIREW